MSGERRAAPARREATAARSTEGRSTEGRSTGGRSTGGRSTGGRSRAGNRTEERARRALYAKRRRRAAAGIVVVLGGVVYAVLAHHGPGAARAAAATHPAAPVHYAVGITSCVFVDHTRATRDYATGTLTPGRVLRTEIRYPTLSGSASLAETANAHPAYGHGPFPLVVFAHGYDVTPDTYANLLDSWVRAGLVVAAPLFPDTNAEAVAADGNLTAPESDDVNQPADVAFVTRSLSAAAAPAAAGCPVVHRLLDTARIALAGQSDGAQTVAALAYATAYAAPTPHISAVEVLSGGEEPAPSGQPGGYRATPGGPALLVVQSATDACNPPEYSTTLYGAIAQADRWFLTIRAGDHLPPYTGEGEPVDYAVVASVTTRFLTDELGGTAPGGTFLRLGNATPSIATLTTGPAPALAPLEQSAAACYLK